MKKIDGNVIVIACLIIVTVLLIFCYRRIDAMKLDIDELSEKFTQMETQYDSNYKAFKGDISKLIPSSKNNFNLDFSNCDCTYNAKELDYTWVGKSQGLIAHALGGYENEVYTNSEEAFIASYNKGFRVLETDVHLTNEGSIVLYHTSADWENATGKNKEDLSYNTFMNTLLYEKLHTLDGRKLVDLMSKYKDAYVVVDWGAPDEYESLLWYSNLAFCATDNNNEDVLDRFIIEINGEQQLRYAKSVYMWKSYILSYYKEDWESVESAISFCKKNNISAVDFPVYMSTESLINQFFENDIYCFAYSVNELDILEQLKVWGCYGVFTDWISP